MDFKSSYVLSCLCIIDGEKMKIIFLKVPLFLDHKTFVHKREMKRNAIISWPKYL